MFVMTQATGDEELLQFIVNALLAVNIISCILLIVAAILIIISMWKLFVKAGKPGWAAIVPVYNIIVMLDIIGLSWWHIFIMLIPFAATIYGIVISFELAKKFGKGTGFAVFTIFFSPIAYPILAFGKAEYQG